MGFWFFMVGCNLLIPATMLIAGKLFMLQKQGGINRIIGYRTAMSMKNEDTWRFAHSCAGKFLWVCGWIFLPLGVIPMLFVLGCPENTVSIAGLCVTGGSLVPLFGCIVYTEIALRKVFDKNGNRKTGVG